MTRILLLAVVALGGRLAMAETTGAIAIVPRPLECRPQSGDFEITAQTRLLASGDAVAEARLLQDELAPAMGFRFAQSEGAEAADGAIVLKLGAVETHGAEGYRLTVTPKRVVIEAAKPAGLFWGMQTLRQLLPPQALRSAKTEGVRWTVPAVEIVDKPRFGWRGLMIDTCRHFMPRSEILRFIDVMALHKMNSLQLHLTDDQGWRIEIKKYPKLTQVGAFREETIVNTRVRGKEPPNFDGVPHGGFYTQDDLREIVAYAAARHINVLPEIEMPGHARAAIAAYPQLGCDPGTPLKPWTQWGVCPDIFNPTEETVQFMQDVLLEVMEIFPSKFIHVGGDEARKDQWKASPAVQARIKELGLKNEEEMQSWFIHQMDAFLTKHGRRLIGWDEILEGGLAPSATVMSWRGEKGGIAAAKAGHDVVMAPTDHTYLDYYQGPPETEPVGIGGDVPLEKVYAYEPIPKDLTAEEAGHVLGAQGQLWAEFIPTPRHLEYMAFPRALALAEAVWSAKEAREWSGFRERLVPALERLHMLDVNYRPLDAAK